MDEQRITRMLAKWMQRPLDSDEYEHWTSPWQCSDGDNVTLYIHKDSEREKSFNLYCFSGIPASNIFIDYVDFGVMWEKATQGKLEFSDYTATQRCIIIADYLCSLFCKYNG